MTTRNINLDDAQLNKLQELNIYDPNEYGSLSGAIRAGLNALIAEAQRDELARMMMQNATDWLRDIVRPRWDAMSLSERRAALEMALALLDRESQPGE
jgi:Arc/MetJ-type ribon-helix-helix transcriptional regulator